MSDRLERVEHKIDVVQKDISDINRTLAVNTELLDIQMRRTEALEEIVDLMQTNQAKFQGGIKVLHWSVGIGLTLAGLNLGLLKLLL